MANLEVQGLDDLNDALSRIGEIPFEVTSKALSEMADIAASKIKASGESMGVRDPESNEHILDKIKRGKPKKTDDGGYADITFSGSRNRNGIRTRNAEIAFVNEYGKRGQAGRPFIGRAMTQNEKAIADSGGNVIGEWIEHEFER